MYIMQDLLEYFSSTFGIDSSHMNEMLSLIDDIKSIDDREYFVFPSGVPGLYNLGEKNNKFLWVSGATPYEILKFVTEKCQQTAKTSSDIKSQETLSFSDESWSI